MQTQVLGSRDEIDARREAVTLMMRVGRFSGYELWGEGREIAEYRNRGEVRMSDILCRPDDFERGLVMKVARIECAE